MVDIWYNKGILFEHDEKKSERNKKKHGIDFEKAKELWEDEVLEFPVRVEGEARWASIGKIGKTYWTAIITKRGEKIRIISVRRSRKYERKLYEEK